MKLYPVALAIFSQYELLIKSLVGISVMSGEDDDAISLQQSVTFMEKSRSAFYKRSYPNTQNALDRRAL
jgi:hypothetical protein